MNQKAKTILSIVVPIVVAGLLVFWVSNSLDLNKVESAIKKANFWYIGISFIMGGMAYWFRSQRWRMLLSSIHYNVSETNAWAAVCINYLMNLLIPRSGEIARCSAIYKTDDVPMDNSIGTVVVERVIDFVCLFIVIALTLIFEFDLVMTMIQDALEQRKAAGSGGTPIWLIITGVVFGLILITAYLYRNQIKQLAIFGKIKEFMVGLKEGIQSIMKLKKRGLFIFYTVLIWVFYYLMTYLVTFAFEESSNLTWADGLFLLVAGGIGMVIPASGGVGSYHAAMTLAFVTLGLSEEVGAAYGIVMHTPHSILAIVLGLISLAIVSKQNKAKKANL